MKKIILFSIFSLLCFIFSIKESSAQYDDNGYNIDDPRYHAEYNFGKFQYNKIWYPIIDSGTFKYYGEKEYAKSFGAHSEAFSVLGNKFSNFFLTKEKVKYVTYLHNGYLYNSEKAVVIKKESSYIVFFLFCILFSVVTYFMSGDKKIGRFESYSIKNDFKFFFLSFLLALCFKFLLYDLALTALKIKNSSIIDFLGSQLMFGFSAYIIIISFFTWLFTGFEEFIFEKLPVIFLGAILAGISFGIAYKEIGYISLYFMLCSAFIFLPIISFLFSKIFYLFKQKEKADE